MNILGNALVINWTFTGSYAGLDLPVDIDLMQRGAFVASIKNSYRSSVGTLRTTVPTLKDDGTEVEHPSSDYRIRVAYIQTSGDSSLRSFAGYSGNFSIVESPTAVPTLVPSLVPSGQPSS